MLLRVWYDQRRTCHLNPILATTNTENGQIRHILIVEDEKTTRTMLAAYLRKEGFTVSEAVDGESMRHFLSEYDIDLILLDILLPGEDGLTLLREIRRSSDIGIIFVTGKGADIDRIIGLEMGADDYITKPFNVRELLARVKTLLRHLDAKAKPEEERATVRKFAGWTLDLGKRRLLSPSDEVVRLTKAEFDLLSAFVHNAGRVLSRDMLLDYISSRDWSPFDRTVDVLIGRLRKKIESDPTKPQFIMTEHGIGYLFSEDVEIQPR